MEKLPHQDFRDALADKLREIRNSDVENPELAHAKARGYLEAKKEELDYTEAREAHLRLNERKIDFSELEAGLASLKANQTLVKIGVKGASIESILAKQGHFFNDGVTNLGVRERTVGSLFDNATLSYNEINKELAVRLKYEDVYEGANDDRTDFTASVRDVLREHEDLIPQCFREHGVAVVIPSVSGKLTLKFEPKPEIE